MWQQQFQDPEAKRRLAEEFWQWHQKAEEEEEQKRRKAEELRWQQAVENERRYHEECRQQQVWEQQARDYQEQQAREEATREEVRRQHSAKMKELQVMKERERHERRLQAALERERLEEQRLQEELERQRQQEELWRLEAEREERRRRAQQEAEREKEEERRRKELERRRQELEREQLRQAELEREERRRQRKLKEKEEELLRERILLEEMHRQKQHESASRDADAHDEGLIENSSSEQEESHATPRKACPRDQTDDDGKAQSEQDSQSDRAREPSRGEEPSGTREDHAGTGSATVKEDEPSSPPRSSLYDVLKVGRNATSEDIRKAYKRQCMKHHPDKGGDRDRFEEVGQAYQILSDKFTREAYDQRGMAGVERLREKERQKQAKPSEPEKVAEKAQAIVVEAYVPLEVAYTGGSVDVQVVRITACALCGGSGTAPGACYMQCPTCEGQGGVPQYLQYGHMIVEQRATCNVCMGQGMVLPSSSLCSTCGGEQLVEEEVHVPFEIPPGVAEKERIVAKGQGHAMPGLSAGDVTLVCRLQEHKQFLRKGDDLLMEHRVPLQVAICGGAFEVPMLSGQSLRVRLPRGSILSPGSIKCVPGEGMPKRQNPHLRGDLVMRFGIDFPESISEGTAARLASAFEGADKAPTDTSEGADVEQHSEMVPPTPERQEGEVYLSDFDMEQFGKTLQDGRETYDDPDEEERARAAAMAAQASQGQRRSYAHSGYFGHSSSFGGFGQRDGGIPCNQM